MEVLAVEMTVWQCISTARRGVAQGFPRRSRVSIKNSLQVFLCLQAALTFTIYFFFFPKYASLISSFSSSSLPLPSILMRPVSST